MSGSSGDSGTAPTSGNKRMFRAWARLRGGAHQPGALPGHFATTRVIASPAPAGSQTGVLQGGRAARLPLPSDGRHPLPSESGSPSRQHRAQAPREMLGQSRRPPQTAALEDGAARESSDTRRVRGGGCGLFCVFVGISLVLVGCLLVWFVSLFVFNVLNFFFLSRNENVNIFFAESCLNGVRGATTSEQ